VLLLFACIKNNNWYSSLFNFAAHWYLLSPISIPFKPSVWTADETLRATEMGFRRAPWLLFATNVSSLFGLCLSAHNWMTIHIYIFIIHYSFSWHGNKSGGKLWGMWNALGRSEKWAIRALKTTIDIQACLISLLTGIYYLPSAFRLSRLFEQQMKR